MKNENGITLITLVVTLVIMIILAVIGTAYGTSTIDAMKFQNFSYQLEQIQGKVDTIHEKINLGDESYKQMGENATFSSKATSLLTKLGVSSSEISDYRYFTSKDLEEDLGILNLDQEILINFKTKDVVSIDGFEYKGTMYHRLYNHNISSNTSDDNEQPKPTYQYVTDGLILHYDGIKNTKSGHSETTLIWEDLSEKNNNGTLTRF